MPNSPNPTPAVRFVRPKDACRLLGITATTLWRWTRERPEFPKPIKLGTVVTVWSVAELEEFVGQQYVASLPPSLHGAPQRAFRFNAPRKNLTNTLTQRTLLPDGKHDQATSNLPANAKSIGKAMIGGQP
jgi:predicted DNA-binding transcriptional regulator AlpA